MRDKEFEELNKLNIILIEDNKDDVGLIKRILHKSKWQCIFNVVDSRDMLVFELNRLKPDLILADYRLPNFSGLEALKICVEKDGSIPFIFVTGAIGEDLAAETIINGACGFVLKNKLENLVQVIETTLRDTHRWHSDRLANASVKISKRIEMNKKALKRVGNFLDQKEDSDTAENSEVKE